MEGARDGTINLRVGRCGDICAGFIVEPDNKAFVRAANICEQNYTDAGRNICKSHIKISVKTVRDRKCDIEIPNYAASSRNEDA